MKKHWMALGMLASVVIADPACKKQPTPEQALLACQSDLAIYQTNLDNDAFRDHLQVFEGGRIEDLPSVVILTGDWKNDDCQKLTGMSVEMVGKAGLTLYYQRMCATIQVSKDMIRDLLIATAKAETKEEREILIDQASLAVLCYKVNGPSDPSHKNQPNDSTNL